MPPNNKTSIISSLVGLPLTIGTQIPAMMKSGRQREELKKIQRQGGAGAVAARQSADQAARDAAAIAGGGNSASRGLNLLTGLRAGEETRARGAEQAARVAAAEGAQATERLYADEVMRQGLIGKVGAGIAGAGAQLDAMRLAAADKSAALEETEAKRQHELEMLKYIYGDREAAAEEGALTPEQEQILYNRTVGDNLQDSGTVIGSGHLQSVPWDDESRAIEDAAGDPDYYGPGLDDLESLQDTPVPTQPEVVTEPPTPENIKSPGDPNASGGAAVPPVPEEDPIMREQSSIEREQARALGSPSAALMVAMGLSPDTILEQEAPGLKQRKLALELMLRGGNK